MMTMKLSIILLLFPLFLLNCNGFVVDESYQDPPLHLSHLETYGALPLQRISDTAKEDPVPPPSHPASPLVEHSDFHQGYHPGVLRLPPLSFRKEKEIPILQERMNKLYHNTDDSESEEHFKSLMSEIKRSFVDTNNNNQQSIDILKKNQKFLKSQIPESGAEERRLWLLILGVLGKFYLPKRDESIVKNPQCIQDLNLIYNPIGEDQQSNASALVDSWGKMPDGLMAGNIFPMGSFDECLYVRMPRNSSDGTFKGKHCSVSYLNFFSDTNETEPLYIEVRIPSVNPSQGSPADGLIPYGTCMPSTCTEQDLRDSLDSFLLPLNLTAGKVFCQTEDDPQLEFTAGLVVMIVILSVFACLLLSGAALDLWIQYSKNEQMRTGPWKYLLVFSFYSNLEKIFKINTTVNKEAITCFYGMRVLSMTWVAWGHQYIMNIYYAGNMFYFSKVFNGHWMNQVLTNAFPSVDSFFFMSGLLVAYGIFKEKERTGGLNVAVFYIHRFIRLSIPILLLSGFMATFPKYLSHGPFAETVDGPFSLQLACQKYWWRDALFIGNFFPFTDSSTTCLGVCWYTAVDSQLYLVTPIILLPFIWGDKFMSNKRQRNIMSLTWLGIVTFVSVIIPGIITGIYKLAPTSVMGVTDPDRQYLLNDKIYMMPWCRAQPFLVGIWLGIFLRKNQNKEKITLQKWQVVVGWLVATVTGLAVIFGMYDYNQISPEDPPYYWPDSIFYASLHRLAWGLALAWVVFACHYGYGGLVNSFLSHPAWQPMSRLTYCIFLVAIPVQKIVYVYNNVYPVNFSHLTKVCEIVGTLFIAGIGAVLLSLCTEAPVLGLERYLLGRGKPKSKS